MVNLQKINPDVFKELGFKNRTKGISFIRNTLGIQSSKYKNEQHFKKEIQSLVNTFSNAGFEINKPWLNDKGEKINMFKNFALINKLEKESKSKRVKKLNEKIAKIEKSINLPIKNYFISAKINRTVTYTNKKGKKYSYVEETIAGKEILNDGRTVPARTEKEALIKYSEEAMENFDNEEPSEHMEYKVDNIQINSITLSPIHETNIQDTKDMPMFLSCPLAYNFIEEEKAFLQLDNKIGTCVIDNFIGMYGQELKINRNDFIELCKEYNNSFGFTTWKIENGITARCVNSICEKYDITHYAFDITKNCFIKNISKNRNHQALVYWCVNNHMYLVQDKFYKKSLIETTKTHENFNTSMLEYDEKVNIFENAVIKVNPEIFYREVSEDKKPIILYYSRPGKTQLNDIFEECLQKFGVPSNIKAKRNKITQFEYTHEEQRFIYCCDPNEGTQVSYKEIMIICKKNNIAWKNQTFVGLIKQLKEKHFDELNGRIELTPIQKTEVLKKCSYKCKNCDVKLEMIKNKKGNEKANYEIDHIRPLANGGNNELTNLQALCKSCHRDKTMSENENGEYIRVNDSESSFNSELQKIMDNPLSFSHAFVESLAEPGFDKTLYTIDINKSRRKILEEAKNNYCVFTVMDSVQPYNNNKIDPGIYYIETNNYLPLRGNGWYYHNMVNYCLDQKYIKNSDIKYFVYSSLSISSTFYNSFIEFCDKNIPNYNEIYDHFNNKQEDLMNPVDESIQDFDIYNDFPILFRDSIVTDYKKTAINSMIGAFKPNHNKNPNWSSICVTKSRVEAYKQFLNNKDSVFIGLIRVKGQEAKYDINTDDLDVIVENYDVVPESTFKYIKISDELPDDIYYHVFRETLRTNVETEAPIYNQIVQQEIIELDILRRLIESKGGTVIDVNTDSITCTFDDDELPFELDDNQIKGYYYNDNKHKYKLEAIGKRIRYPKLARSLRTDTFIYNKQEWNIINDVEDNDFSPIVDKIIESNQGCFLNGPAGCGKSTLIKLLQNKLDERKIKYVTLAPTNLAALLIDGKTVHKFAAKMRKYKQFNESEINYIFIDEISMLKELFYKFMLMIKRLKNVKIIVSGDYNQLEPVADRAHYDYENSYALQEMSDFNKIVLTKCRRSDDKLFKKVHFNNVLNLSEDEFKNEFTEVHLCWTNNKRKEINHVMMTKAFKKRKDKNYIDVEALKYDANSQDVRLTPNMPVIGRVNRKKLNIINNERYIITKLDITNKKIYIKNERVQDSIIIDAKEFQYLFRPGFCSTIHTVQGMSLDKPYTIHEWNKLSHKLKYVALSRARNIEQINIMK